MTNDLHFVMDLIVKMPDLRLLADLSHFVVAREFPDPPHAADEAHFATLFANCWAIHGRVAGSGQIQLPLSFPQHATWVEHFTRWWRALMTNWLSRAPATAVLPFVCELGPQAYAISNRDGYDLSDRWRESLILRDLAKKIWAEVVRPCA